MPGSVLPLRPVPSIELRCSLRYDSRGDAAVKAELSHDSGVWWCVPDGEACMIMVAALLLAAGEWGD